MSDKTLPVIFFIMITYILIGTIILNSLFKQIENE